MKSRTAYILFCIDYRPKLYIEFPDMSPQDITRELGKKWNTLNKYKKESYHIKSKQEKEEKKEKENNEEKENKQDKEIEVIEENKQENKKDKEKEVIEEDKQEIEEEEEEEEEEDKQEIEEDKKEEEEIEEEYGVNCSTFFYIFIFCFLFFICRYPIPPSKILALPSPPKILELPRPFPVQFHFSLYHFLYDLLAFIALIKFL